MTLNGITSKKYFHLIITIVILATILFTLGIIILRYYVEGETNMPFQLSKIAIISTSAGTDKETKDTKWNFDLYQSNDIYLYIDKNNKYEKTEAIKTITLQNFKIEAVEKEKIKIYKPDAQEEKLIFKNKDENITENIEYAGGLESDIKQLKISNQGGIVAFRCSYNNIAEYQTDEEEIKHNELLKKAGIKPEDIKVKVSFDLNIKLEGDREYQATIQLDLPTGNVIEEGTTSTELTETKEFIFKRVNN